MLITRDRRFHRDDRERQRTDSRGRHDDRSSHRDDRATRQDMPRDGPHNHSSQATLVPQQSRPLASNAAVLAMPSAPGRSFANVWPVPAQHPPATLVAPSVGSVDGEWGVLPSLSPPSGVVKVDPFFPFLVVFCNSTPQPVGYGFPAGPGFVHGGLSGPPHPASTGYGPPAAAAYNYQAFHPQPPYAPPPPPPPPPAGNRPPQAENGSGRVRI